MTDNNAAKELQRKMQVLVRDLRAKGKDEKQIKLAKIALKRSLRGGKRGGYSGGRGGSTGGSFGNSSRGGFRDRDGGYGRNRSEGFPRDQSRGGGAQQQRGGRGGFVRPRNRGPSEAQQAAEHREELGKKHDIVLIPIMWKRNETQKEKVLQACNRLKQKLAEHRLNVWIDQRSKYTPGQKYAYWEHLGVQLRGEIGPAELASKTVVLSKCTEPGTVAKRWPNLTTKGNMKELLQQLKACGFQKINVPEKQDDSYGADEYESESESVPVADKPQFANGDTRAQHLKLPAFSGKKRTFEDVTEDDGETKDSNKKSASVDDYGGDSLEVNYVLEDTKPSKKDKKRN